MKKSLLMVLIAVCASVFAFGCTTVRTYTQEDERVDQNLRAGNMGYLSGKPSEDEINRPRKLTRKHYIAEVEIGKYRTTKKKTAKSGMSVEAVEEPSSEAIVESQPEAAPKSDAALKNEAVQSFVEYTVLPNDTLGSISIKVYGTAKKWKKIFEANSDRLKTPDKIYAGQVLKIPQE